ncbi:unnamed protein product [Parnassius apollo]|uniref:(apollo) hypothetical protein n=1 Tax=Parnassius apollo TaxID=110799 RepID=A0A8S3X0D4_PARAO|nr:unnamed protein product [Parnassius apollo]
MTTKADFPRQRLTWNVQMNEDVMRYYYKATRLEEHLIGHKAEMYRLFVLKYPELRERVTEQRVMDQTHQILCTCKIVTERLEQLKAKVAKELYPGRDVSENISVQEATVDASSEIIPDSLTELSTAPYEERREKMVENETLGILKEEFEKALIAFLGTNPLLRPTIGRQINSKKLAVAVNLMNTIIIPEHLAQVENTFDAIHTTTYAAGVAIVRSIGGKIGDSTVRVSTQRKTPAWERRLTHEVDTLRRQLGRLTQYMRGNRTKKVVATYYELQKDISKHTKYSAKSLPDRPNCIHKKTYECNSLTMSDLIDFHTCFYKHRDKRSQDAFILKHMTISKVAR